MDDTSHATGAVAHRPWDNEGSASCHPEDPLGVAVAPRLGPSRAPWMGDKGFYMHINHPGPLSGLPSCFG